MGRCSEFLDFILRPEKPGAYEMPFIYQYIDVGDPDILKARKENLKEIREAKKSIVDIN